MKNNIEDAKKIKSEAFGNGFLCGTGIGIVAIGFVVIAVVFWVQKTQSILFLSVNAYTYSLTGGWIIIILGIAMVIFGGLKQYYYFKNKKY